MTGAVWPTMGPGISFVDAIMLYNAFPCFSSFVRRASHVMPTRPAWCLRALSLSDVIFLLSFKSSVPVSQKLIVASGCRCATLSPASS